MFHPLEIHSSSVRVALSVLIWCALFRYFENGAARDNSRRGIWFGTSGGQRLLSRFIGHCNMHTDIKESTFVGQNDDLVACGSDDGNVFIYDAVRVSSTNSHKSAFLHVSCNVECD